MIKKDDEYPPWVMKLTDKVGSLEFHIPLTLALASHQDRAHANADDQP